MSNLNGVSTSLQIHVRTDVPGLQSMVFVVGGIGSKAAKGCYCDSTSLVPVMPAMTISGVSNLENPSFA